MLIFLTQGPPGPSQIFPDRVYVFGPSITVDPGNATAFNTCNTGDVLLGGGWGFTGENVTSGYGLPFDQNQTFVAHVEGSGLVGAFANVVCFDNPPLRP